MMGQGGASAEAGAQAGVNPVQVTMSQGNTYRYYSSTDGSTAAPWSVQGGESQITQNGNHPNLNSQYNPIKEVNSASVNDAANPAPVNYVPPTTGAESASQAYPTYVPYSTPVNSYNYGSTGYSSYYNHYQPQPAQSYTQPVVGYQNTGAPYQPNPSFQNTGSYAGNPSYSSTYYNPGDYQTCGGYAESGFNSQTNSWPQGTYPNFNEQYATYSHDSGSAYHSAVAPAVPNYQQQYKQWPEHYSQTEVTCAPGTENKTTASTPTLTCPTPGVYAGNVPPASQPQPSHLPTWKPDPGFPAPAAAQSGAAAGAHGTYWGAGTQNYPNQANFLNHPGANSSFITVQDSQQSAGQQFPLPLPNGTNQVTTFSHQALQPLQSTETRKVSKMQIPTNPRIASNLAMSLHKSKDGSTPSVAAKPAYVGVSLSKPSEKTSSTHGSDAVLKPGVFPASLRGYVERALARCKDEKQMAASQEVMKQMITKATADGTLHSRDWDIEPLFPLPDSANESLGEMSVSSLSKVKRSPGRRTKSRWEPMPEEKIVEKPTSTNHSPLKYAGWAQNNGREKKFTGMKSESKESGNNNFSFFESATMSKSAQRPFKKQRFGEHNTDNGDASSDSDQEKGLTAYYSGAMALASSPEERKRRESRSKRFERTHGRREQMDTYRPKTAGSGDTHSRRATASVLSKSFDDSSSRAVEDIDWDALTVKGTCQEIEKRYLRLTSAPDPATVRPEEVLEKALTMVQNSQKSYLYKCDQLKSIRQDLTVQRIRNELTVKVYETHTRLALEFGDLPEYNQCQSQLKFLYGEGIAGCHMEFSAYGLLSVILHSNNKREFLSSMSRLSDEAKRDEAVKHAIAVRGAVNSGNYVLFFRLYKAAPNLNACLMDLYAEKMRFQAVQCMSRAYRPTVPVSYLARLLGFSSLHAVDTCEEGDTDGIGDCIEWLKAHGACLVSGNNGEMELDAKASSSSLYMPEPEDAVAHGDANLAVNDFFTRTSS